MRMHCRVLVAVRQPVVLRVELLATGLHQAAVAVFNELLVVVERDCNRLA